MWSAFGEPPLSGTIAPAKADPAKASSAAKATRTASANRRARLVAWVRAKARPILFTARRTTGRRRSPACERRRPLLDERGDAFVEVGRAGHLLLDVGLEVELLLHPRVQPVVELALRAGIGASGTGGQAVAQRRDVLGEGGVGEHAVDRPHS